MNTSCICKFCEQSFVISGKQEALLRQMRLPLPTLCPLDRLKRRLAFRNSHWLYRRTCDLCNKNILSIYRPQCGYTVYCPECWWSDGWDSSSFGRSFDFNRPFFDQYDDLMKSMPLPALITEGSENCDYCQNTTFSKNCYLAFATVNSEDCYYGDIVQDCRDVVDCRNINSCELCYECVNCRRCYRGVYMQNCESCFEVEKLEDCLYCFHAANLKNSSDVFGALMGGELQ